MVTSNFTEQSNDYRIIEKLLHFLSDHKIDRPNLNAIAEKAGYSPFHVQRVFKRWVGISPKQFLDFLTLEHAKKLLDTALPLYDLSMTAGLSGSGRLHDLFVKIDGMTPGEYRSGGLGVSLAYGFHPTPFGECFIAVTSRGISALFFLSHEDERDAAITYLKSTWPLSSIKPDQQVTANLIQKVFSASEKDPVQLFVKGSAFQLQVWKALLRIPSGSLVSYQVVAAAASAEKACRAVGTAIGQNPVSYLIPCHRVIRKMGEFGNYRWGSERKKAMIAWEQVRLQTN